MKNTVRETATKRQLKRSTIGFRLRSGTLNRLILGFCFIGLSLLPLEVYAQCTNLKGKVFRLPDQDTIVFDGFNLVGAEANGFDSVQFWITEEKWQPYRPHAGFRDWSERYSPKITVVPEAYTKGIRKVVFSRNYIKDGKATKSCEDSIKLFFESTNDKRFDSLKSPELTMGTGAGAFMFTNFSKGLCYANGWDLSLFDLASLWVSGIESKQKEPHFSGQFFDSRRSGNIPYESYFGPAQRALTQSEASYEKVWKLTKDDLNYNFSFRDYPLHIRNNQGVEENWAPYVDLDSDGNFDYQKDYPCLLGDEMLFTSYHFKEDTIGFDRFFMPINVKQYMFMLKDTTFADVAFMRFEIINYSDEDFDSVMLGFNSHMGPMAYNTYRMGCDTQLNMFFSYGDGAKPGFDSILNPALYDSLKHMQQTAPSLGVAYLSHEMTNFMPFSKGLTSCTGGWPSGPEGFRNIMETKDTRGKPYFYGDPMCEQDSVGRVSKQLFPGNPLDTTAAGGWHMEHKDHWARSFSATGSHGYTQLKSHDTLVFDLALLVSYNGQRGRLQNIKALKSRTAQVQEYYAKNGFGCFDPNALGTPEAYEPQFRVYPNPGRNLVTIHSPVEAHFQLLGMDGKTFMSRNLSEGSNSINLNGLAGGVYTLRFENAQGLHTQKLVVQK